MSLQVLMTFSRACCVAAAIVLCHVSLHGEELSVVDPSAVGMSSQKLRQVDATMQRFVENQQVAGAVVLIAKDSRIVHFSAYGKSDIADDTPMTTDAIFRIYSMSKAITSAAVMMLVEQDKVNLDAAVSTYIPEFAEVSVYTSDGLRRPGRPPTVRDLLRHTAGLTYGIFGDSPVDRQYRQAGVLSKDDTLKTFGSKVGKLPLDYDPGTSWKYSVATDVLGRIVEVASGQPFDTFLSSRIFQPLGMVDTGFHVPADKLRRFTTNYTPVNGTLQPTDGGATSVFAKPKAFLSGGGGLVSTTGDYFRFLLMISQNGRYADGQLLSEESIRLMTTNQLPDGVDSIQFGANVREGVGFGLGFSVRTRMSDWDPGGRVGEYGWGGAASTHYWVCPRDNLIVITMEQIMPYNFATEFALKKAIYEAIE